MGKPGGGRKKQNAGVGVDFKRVKHRVGKKLPRAQNQTDTSFKSRTISLAEQSLATDKEGLAVTTRNLTLKDLLGQCGHYSERVRRDALQGLAELLAAHPEELRRHATLVVEAAAARVGDGDPTVRTAARELLATRLLPALGDAAVAPYVPLLMAHVCAAMTHLAEPIRADALGFLELLVEVRPDLVAAGFLPPVLLHFSDLLSRGTRGRSIKAGSLASLATVAASLRRFLARTLPAATALGPGASLTNGLAGGIDGVVGGGPSDGMGSGQQAGVLFWQRCAWPPLDQSGTSSHPSAAVAAEGSGGGGGGSSSAVSSKSGEAADVGCSAAASLLGRLLECWSEAGPSQLALTGDLMAAQCLTAILSCCDLLLGTWGASLAGSVHDRTSLAARLLTSVTPHFPVLRPATPVAPALADQLVALNVAAAQLLARFLPAQAAAGRGAGTADVVGRPAGTAAGQAKVKEEAWVGRLLEWFAGVMAEGAALPAADSNRLFEEAPAEMETEAIAAATGEGAGGSSGSKRRRGSSSKSGGSGNAPREAGLPKEVYQSALDSSLRVLPLLPPPRRRQLLTAAAALWQRSTPRGAARPRVLAFWAALLRDPASAFYAPTPGGGPLLQQADPSSWLAALPRYLFELGSNNPSASHAALCLLMAAARAAPAGGQLATALQELQKQMAPLFAVLLPPVNGEGSGGRHAASKKQQQNQEQKGQEQTKEQEEQEEQPRVHVGPLASLPVATQELAVDLLYHFPAASEQLLRSAAVVCLAGSYPVATAQRLLEVLASKAAAGAADPAAFCGLLLNVLSGSSAAGLRQCSWERHMAIVETACDAALRLGRPADVAAALLPALLDAACGEKTGNAGGSGNGTNSSRVYAAYGLLRLSASLSSAAAAALEELELPSAVVEAVPRLMLQMVDAGQQQERTAAVSQQQHEQQARQQQERQQQGSSGSDALSCQAATALSLRLICLLPQQLVPALLAELSGSLAAAQQGTTQHMTAQNVLPAALGLLEVLVGEMKLREALLERQEGVQAALTACRAACEAAGSVTHGGRDCLQSLRQLEALCGAVLAV